MRASICTCLWRVRLSSEGVGMRDVVDVLLLLLCVWFRLTTTVRLSLEKADCIVPEDLV